MNWAYMTRDDRAAAIRAGVADGHTASEIGARYGVSKNVIIGQAYREKVPLGPHTNQWRPNRVDLMITLWDAGNSAAVIADRLGLTKSAVNARMYRIRKARKDAACRPTKMMKAPGRPRKDAPRAAQHVRPVLVHRRIPTPIPIEPPGPPPSLDGTGQVPLLHRAPLQCSWIDGDPKVHPIMCCGLPVAGSDAYSWCAAHRRIGLSSAPDKRLVMEERRAERMGAAA